MQGKARPEVFMTLGELPFAASSHVYICENVVVGQVRIRIWDNAMKWLPLVFIVLFTSVGSVCLAERPNILFIMTDQHFADAMSGVMGDEYVKTPNLDSLAESGVRFDRAYAPNPICVPARNSIFSGYYPFETGLQTNSKKPLPERMVSMGKHFKDAGYDTGYFGKWHLNMKTSDSDRHGFEETGVLKGNGADHLIPEPTIAFLNRKRDKPFLLVASFTGPHDICQMVRGEKIPGGPIGEFPAPEDCPPVPINVAPPIDETDSMTLMRKSYQATSMTINGVKCVGDIIN
jgi:choline-sulfatase